MSAPRPPGWLAHTAPRRPCRGHRSPHALTWRRRLAWWRPWFAASVQRTRP